jgi:predicted amidohydrolase YtcJ
MCFVARTLALAFGFSLLGSSAYGQQLGPDLILVNGKVFTSSASHPYIEALAVRGERITAVGSSKEIAALAGKDTKRIDLGNRVVIPGINDAHLHLSVASETYDLPMQGNDPTWQEIKDALLSAVVKTAKGTWIEAAIGASVLDDPQATRTALDSLAPDNPVVLWDWTGHASLLNTPAVRKLGIRENEPNPEGGMYVRNRADGKLTGMVFEFAQFQASRRFSELVSDQEAEQQLQEFFNQAGRWGITTVQNMAIPITAERCTALFEKAPPPLRVRVIWFGLTDEHVSDEGTTRLTCTPGSAGHGERYEMDSRRHSHRTFRRHEKALRGSSQHFGRTELLREGNGRDVARVVAARRSTDGSRRGRPHRRDVSERDGCNRRKGGLGQTPSRMEHGDGILPDLIPRVRELGIVVVQNPTHLTLRDLMVRRYGIDRTDQLQPLRSLLDAGIPLALGSDGPPNPFLNIMLARMYPGKPKEAITRDQAVTAYTLTSAYAEFAEKDKGSLEPGKLADLAVLSQDIFKVSGDELPKTESVLTLVNGKIVYDAKVLVVH